MDNRTIATILCAGLALAIPAAAQRELSLDQKIGQALALHPEILMAQAKVHQADAELRIARLKVTQQVIKLHAQQEAQRRLVASMYGEVQRARVLYEGPSLYHVLPLPGCWHP